MSNIAELKNIPEISFIDGISLEDKQAVNRELLRCGANICEMNTIRRHLSSIKGGRLAAACHPARVVNLLISDVPGDNPMDIASGPTVADPTTCADALAIVRRHGIDLPISSAVRAVLHGDLSPAEGLQQLLAREQKPEYPETLFKD